MSRRPKPDRRTRRAADAGKTTTKPTQSLGIREAQTEKNRSDPTRRVHPDGVPLEGAPQLVQLPRFHG